METGWAALAVPGEKLLRAQKCCSPSHRQGRGGSCSRLLQKWGDVSHSALPIEGGCRERKLHSPHFLVAFNEGREHK